MQKVLVVEDFDSYFKIIDRDLKGKVQVLRAQTLEEGWDLLQSHPDTALIIMDACVPGHEPNAAPVVRQLRHQGFTEPIIACSNEPDYRQDLMRAGATQEADKGGAAELALQILGLL